MQLTVHFQVILFFTESNKKHFEKIDRLLKISQKKFSVSFSSLSFTVNFNVMNECQGDTEKVSRSLTKKYIFLFSSKSQTKTSTTTTDDE